MVAHRLVDIIDFRTTQGAFTKSADEALGDTWRRLLKDYSIIIIALPITLVVCMFIYSPLAFWPLVVEILLRLDFRGLLLIYVILFFFIELTMNFDFTRGLFDTLFFLAAFPLLKRQKRRQQLGTALGNITYGFIRLGVKTMILVSLTSSIVTMINE